MTWKDFIVPIRKSGIFGDASYKILLELFEQAGSKIDISDVTAKSWLSGNRNCKATTYFPTGKIDTKNLFRYFRNRPDSKLKQLQQMFQPKENVAPDSPIDVKTDDMDILCWSLVNQFLDLLKFERVDIPQPQSDTIHVGTTLFPHDNKCCVYCIHWKGSRGIIGVSRIPVHGTCYTHNGNKHHLCSRLSSTAACSDYEADEDLMNRMKEYGFDIENLI